MKNEDSIVTDPRYWDCECKKNYIHLKKIKSCPRCTAVEAEQPDSRVNELKMLVPGYEPLKIKK